MTPELQGRREFGPRTKCCWGTKLWGSFGNFVNQLLFCLDRIGSIKKNELWFHWLMLKSSAHSLWNPTASESRSDGQVGLPWVSSKEGTISTCLLSSPRTLCSWGTTESDINTQQLAFLLSSSLSPRSQLRDFWNTKDSDLSYCSLEEG